MSSLVPAPRLVGSAPTCIGSAGQLGGPARRLRGDVSEASRVQQDCIYGRSEGRAGCRGDLADPGEVLKSRGCG